MTDEAVSIEEMLALLYGAPERIAFLTAGLSAEQLRTRPGPDEWSANDVLAHLRSCADVWGDTIVALLATEHPTIRAINPRSWIRRTDYPDLAFASSFSAYAKQRVELLVLLESLEDDDWARTATFTGAGSPIVRTVLSFGRRIAIHERPHLKQMQRVVDAVRR